MNAPRETLADTLPDDATRADFAAYRSVIRHLVKSGSWPWDWHTFAACHPHLYSVLAPLHARLAPYWVLA